MILRSIILAGITATLGTGASWAQGILTENINNTGIPRNAAPLNLPAIYGLNPCSTGATVGVTTPLFGIGGAVSSIDRECETRNNAAVVITGLKDETLGREILCEIKDVREAAIRVGKPCLDDQGTPKVTSAAAVSPAQPASPLQEIPVAANTPVTPAQPVAPAQRVTVAAAAPVRATIRADAPAFCHTNDLDVSLYPDCTESLAPASPIGPGKSIRPVVKTLPPPPASKPPGGSNDGAAAATAQKRAVSAPRLASCNQRPREATGGPCQADARMFIALERTWIELIARRRSELAQADQQHDDINHSSAETPVARNRTPTAPGPLLAYVTKEN